MRDDEKPIERYLTIVGGWAIIAVGLTMIVFAICTHWPVDVCAGVALIAAVPGALFGLFLVWRINRKYSAWIRDLDSSLKS